MLLDDDDDDAAAAAAAAFLLFFFPDPMVGWRTNKEDATVPCSWRSRRWFSILVSVAVRGGRTTLVSTMTK